MSSKVKGPLNPEKALVPGIFAAVRVVILDFAISDLMKSQSRDISASFKVFFTVG